VASGNPHRRHEARPGRHAARPGRHRGKRRPIGGTQTTAVALVALTGVGLAVHGARREEPVAPPAKNAANAASQQTRHTTDTASRARPVAMRVGRVTVDSDGFLSWALLDRRTGRITGSANFAAPSDAMSMVKAWLAADYLRQHPEPTRAARQRLRIMIRDSDNAAAQAIYREVGRTESIERMIETCRLTDSAAVPGLWSNTVVSARDVVRLGLCLADGRAAGPVWTDWLMNEMREVRGTGDFGVRTALDDDTVAIKNGWLLRDEDGLWHVSCLAVADRWVIAVLARYPGREGLETGADLCRDVGAQLLGIANPVVAAAARG
jgi:hypothetical protein